MRKFVWTAAIAAAMIVALSVPALAGWTYTNLHNPVWNDSYGYALTGAGQQGGYRQDMMGPVGVSAFQCRNERL